MRIFLVSLLFTTSLFAWGLRGHRIVARIAENHLTESARAQIDKILSGETLVRVANQPDHLRSNNRWQCAAPLHYASVDDDTSYLASWRNPKGDIVEALLFFEDVLRDANTSPLLKKTATVWLTHLVGDMHQPLHVGRACDRGGNSVKIKWFKEPSNLHKLWDSQLINHQELSFSEYAQEIDRATEEERHAWAKATYFDWITEAQNVRKQIYTCFAKDGCCKEKENGACLVEETRFNRCEKGGLPPHLALEYAYVENNRALMNAQLLKAGVRLAALFNRIFDGTPLTNNELKLRSNARENKTSSMKAIEACIKSALH